LPRSVDRSSSDATRAARVPGPLQIVQQERASTSSAAPIAVSSSPPSPIPSMKPAHNSAPPAPPTPTPSSSSKPKPKSTSPSISVVRRSSSRTE
jgi:hypothetical protein